MAREAGLGEFNLLATDQVFGKLHYWNFEPVSSIRSKTQVTPSGNLKDRIRLKEQSSSLSEKPGRAALLQGEWSVVNRTTAERGVQLARL